MGLFDSMARRLGLMDQMAEKLGADVKGQGPQVYREAVVRCAQCVHPTECKSYLEQEAGLKEAPDYCRNKALLEGLAAEK